MADTTLPSTARQAHSAVLAFAAAASLMLGACLQTDPASPDKPDPTIIPEDNGRRAGASSSTNWPAENTGNAIRIKAKTIPELEILFLEANLKDTGFLPIKMEGELKFYRSGAIPALDSTAPKVLPFSLSSGVVIPTAFLDSLWNTPADSQRFNIEIKCDTTGGWLMGFVYSKREKKIVSSPYSIESANPPFLRTVKYFFTGNLKVDTTVITPVSGNSEFCFYIPGTSIFSRVKADAEFKIGPLPLGDYPLRLLRISQTAAKPGQTLVEAWEAPVDQDNFDSLMTPGAKVLSVQAQGILNLRNAE